MAKVWVYVWDHDRSTSWGHTSLQVDGGAYVSWWPSDAERTYTVDRKAHPRLAGFMKKVVGTSCVYKVQHRCNTSYRADAQNEGREAMAVVEIADGVLDTNAIQMWWTGYNYAKASYHVLKKNCSTTVIRALRAGGGDAHAGINAPDFLSKRKGWEPTDVLSYLRRMERSLGGEKVNLNGSRAHITPPPRINIEQQRPQVVIMCEEHNQPFFDCTVCLADLPS